MSPIKRNVLSDQVKEHIVHAILTGQLAPGSRIIETAVASELGVSGAPVREALRDLEAVGVVEIIPYKGASVRRMDRAELAEAYGIRAEIESYGTRLALPLVDDIDIDELQVLINRMKNAASVGDTLTEAQVDADFHGRLIDIASNNTLRRVWLYMKPLARTYITHAAHQVRPIEIADLHQPIVDALAQRDGDAAAEAVRRHFRLAGDMLDLQSTFDGSVAELEAGLPAFPRPDDDAALRTGKRRLRAVDTGG